MQLGGPLLEKHHVSPNHTKLARQPQSIHRIYFWIQKGFRGDCEVKGEKVVEPTAMLSVGAYEIMF